MINCNLFKRKTIITKMFMKKYVWASCRYRLFILLSMSYTWNKIALRPKNAYFIYKGLCFRTAGSITNEATSCSRNAGTVGGPVWLFVSRPAADIVPRTSPRPRPANPSVLPEQLYSVTSLSYGVTSTRMLYAFAFSNLLLFRESIVIVKKSKLRF